MADEAGKTVREADPEVSEAVDFARYYATADVPDVADGAPIGVVVVASPWNFPYAIPAGGVLAALMAGNAVLLKPPPETRRTAWLLAQQCWRAGLPDDVLQFVACPDDDVGRRLITHPDVGTVVLTGAHATAQLFLDWKPSMRLLAETSGKNAIVVTESADVGRGDPRRPPLRLRPRRSEVLGRQPADPHRRRARRRVVPATPRCGGAHAASRLAGRPGDDDGPADRSAR